MLLLVSVIGNCLNTELHIIYIIIFINNKIKIIYNNYYLNTFVVSMKDMFVLNIL